MAVWRHRTEGINHRPERFQLLEHLLHTATRDERFDHFVRDMVHHGERIALIALLAQLCFLQESARCEEGFIFLDARITGNCRPRIIDRSLLVVVHGDPRPGIDLDSGRSEEHTSELQSLMRISYSAFCLKKKNNHKPKHNSTMSQHNY